MGRMLVIIGLAIAAVGLAWPWLRRLGIGRLPGDIYVRGDHVSFYLPLTTCLLASAILSLLIWLLHR